MTLALELVLFMKGSGLRHILEASFSETCFKSRGQPRISTADLPFPEIAGTLLCEEAFLHRFFEYSGWPCFVKAIRPSQDRCFPRLDAMGFHPRSSEYQHPLLGL